MPKYYARVYDQMSLVLGELTGYVTGIEYVGWMTDSYQNATNKIVVQVTIQPLIHMRGNVH